MSEYKKKGEWADYLDVSHSAPIFTTSKEFTADNDALYYGTMLYVRLVTFRYPPVQCFTFVFKYQIKGF